MKIIVAAQMRQKQRDWLRKNVVMLQKRQAIQIILAEEHLEIDVVNCQVRQAKHIVIAKNSTGCVSVIISNHRLLVVPIKKQNAGKRTGILYVVPVQILADCQEMNSEMQVVVQIHQPVWQESAADI